MESTPQPEVDFDIRSKEWVVAPQYSKNEKYSQPHLGTFLLQQAA